MDPLTPGIPGSPNAPISQYTMTMPKWHVELTVVLTPEGPFFLIRQMCGILGVANVGQMLQRMRDDDLLPEYMRQWSVQTRGGRQMAWCIHKRAVGYWLAFINSGKVRKEFQDRLKELKRECLDLIDRAFWGEVESTLPAPIESTMMTVIAQTAENTQDIAQTQELLLWLEDRMGAIEEKVFLPDRDE